MKSKLFLTLFLLAAISTIGISQQKKVVYSADITQTGVVEGAEEVEKARLAELERIYRLPVKVHSLVGVKGISVDSLLLNETINFSDLTQREFRKDVQSTLRLAGIKVYSLDQWFDSEEKPSLRVEVSTITGTGDPRLFCNVSVSFYQRLRLIRSPFTSVFARTWNNDVRGICSESELPEWIRQNVKQGLDKFIKDYLTANPKK